MGNGAASSHDIEWMISELKAAGWVARTSSIWREPGTGLLFLGPAGAWRRMCGVKPVLRQAPGELERLGLVARSMKIRDEIVQIFDDCASWNDNIRKVGEPMIDADPDGALGRRAAGLDRMLAVEADR